MISKKKKLAGSLFAVFAVLGILALGLGVIYFTTRGLPFEFSDEQLRVAHLKEKKDFGSYKFIKDFPLGNPVENNKTITLFLGKEAEYAKVGENVSFVAVSETPSDYDKLLDSLINQQCKGQTYTEGSLSGKRYFYAMCGGDSFYVFKSAAGWILFSTPDGDAALKEIIASYV
jgi:hypothetical protein